MEGVVKTYLLNALLMTIIFLITNRASLQSQVRLSAIAIRSAPRSFAGRDRAISEKRSK
jgi:hypothetical protein